MKNRSIYFVIGIILLVVGLSMIFPLLAALYYGEVREIKALLFSMIITAVTGVIISRITEYDPEMTNREGILIGAISWIVVPLFGCLPFIFSGLFPSIFDAYFEAVSGFTTTGATVLVNIEAAPRSILLWRSITQWLGGMGILLVFVAVVPRPGIGSIRLLKAETPSPYISKIAPRFTSYAKYIWIVYIILTLLELFLLSFSGIGFYEALNHTLTSISTGGFSTRDGGLGAFNNVMVETIVIIFMIIGGGNYVLYYILFSQKNPLLLFKDQEYRSYLTVLFVGFILVGMGVYFNYFGNWSESIRYGLFQAISITTGTGHVTYNYDLWPVMVKMLFVILFFFGGCRYSTTGGIKMVRMLIAIKFMKGEIIRNIHPNLVYHVKVNNEDVPDLVVRNVIGFFLLYIVSFFLTALFLSGFGFDILSSISASAAIISNVGPALELFGPMKDYSELPGLLKIWLSFTMVLGRLEIYPLLIFFRTLVIPGER